MTKNRVLREVTPFLKFAHNYYDEHRRSFYDEVPKTWKHIDDQSDSESNVSSQCSEPNSDVGRDISSLDEQISSPDEQISSPEILDMHIDHATLVDTDRDENTVQTHAQDSSDEEHLSDTIPLCRD